MPDNKDKKPVQPQVTPRTTIIAVILFCLVAFFVEIGRAHV